MKKKTMIVLALAFALVLSMCGCGSGGKTSKTTFAGNAHLFVKINPSFEIVASDGIVTDLKAANEDAESIIGKIEYENKSVSDVVKEISSAAVESNFLKDGGEVIYGVIDGDLDDENRSKALESMAEGVDDMNSELHMEVKAVEGCSVCWGSGVCEKCGDTGVPGYAYCFKCEGSGKDTCFECSGSGHEDSCVCGGNGVCYRCNNTGIFDGHTCDVCNGLAKCHICNGTGQRPCGKCGGTGIMDCDPCQGSGMELCPQCHGSAICPVCGGSGLKQ